MTRRGLAIAGFILTAAALLASCSPPGPGTATQPSKSSLATTPAPTPRETPAQAQTPAPSTSPTGRASAAAMTAADVYSFNRDLVLSVLARHGSARALDTLGRLARNEAGVSGVCHAIAHDLGHAALDLAGGRVGDALTDRDDVCGGGFTHGVIEHALAESADPGADMLNVCAPQQDGSCWHGVGHGLMFASGMDTVRALAGCDRAPRPVLSSRCGEGVFMQLFSADLAAGHAEGTAAGHAAHGNSSSGASARAPIARDPAAAREACRSISSPHDAPCWFYAPVVWLTVHPDDFAGGIEWCRGAGTGFPSTQCARGLGSRTVKFHPDDLSIGARTCGAARELLDACVNGMGSYWSVHWEGAVPPRDLCAHLPKGKARKRCPTVTE